MDEHVRYAAFMARLEADKAAGVVIPLTTPEQVALRDRVRAKLQARQAQMRRDQGKK